MLLVLACDRFERVNPNDPKAELGPEIRRGDAPLILNDATSLGSKNNDNGVLEAEEQVELTVPMEVRRSPGGVTVRAIIVNEDDSECVQAVAQPAVPSEITLPTTTGLETGSIAAGPFSIELGRAGCDPDTPLRFTLMFEALEVEGTFTVPFAVSIEERDGNVEIDDVDVDDRSGNDNRALNAGEEASLDIDLRNAGDSLLREVELDLGAQETRKCVAEASLPGNDPLEFGDIEARETVGSMKGSVEVRVDGKCEDGDELRLPLEVRDNAGQIFERTWKIRLGDADAGM
ncbi:MAG: hypothetical protein OXU20_25850 [Myxococcales bacterium]|nr:hypothetical protein [Myxococcales bacterium]MDD9970474.1 hypothetical protein [Myxococcales bacterium]